jgi:Uma2 family endonuclease
MNTSISTIILAPQTPLPEWKPATWEDYLAYRDDTTNEKMRLFFYQNSLLVINMTSERINHASISDLLTMLFILWFNQTPEQILCSLGRRLLEKAPLKAAAPDLVLC